MIQGGTRLGSDIPPYTIVGREPVKYCGLNLVGLRRRGYSNETIDQIHEAYRIVYSEGLNVKDAVQKLKTDLPQTPEVKYITEFIESSKRGIVK